MHDDAVLVAAAAAAVVVVAVANDDFVRFLLSSVFLGVYGWVRNLGRNMDWLSHTRPNYHYPIVPYDD